MDHDEQIIADVISMILSICRRTHARAMLAAATCHIHIDCDCPPDPITAEPLILRAMIAKCARHHAQIKEWARVHQRESMALVPYYDLFLLNEARPGHYAQDLLSLIGLCAAKNARAAHELAAKISASSERIFW